MKVKAMVLVTVFAILGCEEQEEENRMEVVDNVSFLTSNGDEVEIEQMEDGSVVFSLINQGSSNELLKDFLDGSTDLITFYEEFTDESEIPDGIIRMNNRIQVIKDAQIDYDRTQQEDSFIPVPMDDSSTSTPDVRVYSATNGSSLQKQYYSTNSFISTFCDDYFDREICYTRKTNNYKIQGWMEVVWTDAYVYRGTLNHKIRRKYWGNWSTIRDNSVPAGYRSTMYRWASGNRDYLKAEVWNATGDGWHMHIGWRS